MFFLHFQREKLASEVVSTDELYMTIIGKGGHAAMPADYVNPVLIASTIIAALHQFFMDENTKLRSAKENPTVLAFGKIDGMGATNVIPDKVLVEGTFRTMNEEWRSAAHEYMKKTAIAIARDMGGDCEFRVENGYPFLVNDPTVTDKAKIAAENYLGKENVVELEKRMTAEDFAFFSQKLPACFFRLGTASTDGKNSEGVHTSNFDIDEKALETGMGLMAWIAIDALQG